MNMVIILNYIEDELRHPFRDPREYRSPEKLMLSNA